MENLSYQKSMIVSNYTDGKIEGLDEGLKKGIEKGKIEEKMEIAKKMKNMDLYVKVIRQATDLIVDEITKIKN